MRGRPAHVRTTENANKINLLFATGEDEDAAAAALNICTKTLRKHYFPECEKRAAAAAAAKAQLLQMLWTLADAGKASAIKELFARIDKGDLDRMRLPRKPDPKAPPMGKKEKRLLDARTAGEGSEWEGLIPN
ncbi:MAG: hypothetical protein ACK4ZW_05860 [Blastomonas sp.]